MCREWWYGTRCTLTDDKTLYNCSYLVLFKDKEQPYGNKRCNIYIHMMPNLSKGLDSARGDYIETTTTAVEGGITDNVPRLDYTDSSCPALLLEPQRTNLMPYAVGVHRQCLMG